MIDQGCESAFIFSACRGYRTAYRTPMANSPPPPQESLHSEQSPEGGDDELSPKVVSRATSPSCLGQNMSKTSCKVEMFQFSGMAHLKTELIQLIMSVPLKLRKSKQWRALFPVENDWHFKWGCITFGYNQHVDCRKTYRALGKHWVWFPPTPTFIREKMRVNFHLYLIGIQNEYQKR